MLIAASLFVLDGASTGFPAPWALLPVTGAALVISAGVNEEPRFQQFLRNPISTYVGDISYSLYLVHWPIIVFAAVLMDVGGAYSVVVTALAFALAMASYHFVENPLRRADVTKARRVLPDIRKRRFEPKRSTQYAGVAALGLLVLALTAYSLRPEVPRHSEPPSITAAAAPNPDDPAEPVGGPLASALSKEIAVALQAAAWPQLDPAMEEVIGSSTVAEAIRPCDNDNPTVDIVACTYGSPTAPKRIVLVGDSEGNSYAGALREIVMNSNGRLQLLNMSMQSCAFTAEVVNRATLSDNCEARKRNAIDTINATRPDIVVIANLYRLGKNVDDDQFTTGEWTWRVPGE